MPKINEHDFPIEECAVECERVISEGGHIFQKFSCEKCGKRLAMDVPDRLFTTGSCDACGHVSNIAENGCNYVIIGSWDTSKPGFHFTPDDGIERAILAVRGDVAEV